MKKNKYKISVGDKTFIVKAKDDVQAVNKLKSSLADASGERDVVFNKYYVKPGMKIWLNGKFQPIHDIEWGYKYAKVYTNSSVWYEFDVGKKVTVKDAKTMGRYKSKSGKTYIIKEDTGYGSIGSYPYVTDDRGKWVPVPNEIRKGGFKALYELIHSGDIEKYITDSSIKDASYVDPKHYAEYGWKIEKDLYRDCYWEAVEQLAGKLKSEEEYKREIPKLARQIFDKHIKEIQAEINKLIAIGKSQTSNYDKWAVEQAQNIMKKQ